MAGWRGRPGSNRTPPVWKTGTQPTTPRPQEWNSHNGRGRRRCNIRTAPSVLQNPIDPDGISDPVCARAESTGIEPVRPEGLDALASRCLAARPTLQFKWRACPVSNPHKAVWMTADHPVDPRTHGSESGSRTRLSGFADRTLAAWVSRQHWQPLPDSNRGHPPSEDGALTI